LVFVLSLFVLLSSLLYVRFSSVDVNASNGYPVHNIDTGLNYTTIQEAIDANETLDGHTVFVEEGMFNEHVVVNKTLSLIGNGETTIIDGNGNGTVLCIIANNVSLNGFTIKNSLEPGYGFGNGIHIYSSGNKISGNMVKDSFDGIYINNTNNNIFNNVVTNNFMGIYLEFSVGNSIKNNNVTFNKYNGVTLRYSDGNNVSNNRLTNNHLMSILIDNSDGNTINNNIILRNGDGIWLDGSANNVINNNTIAHNEWGIYLRLSGSNSFRKNNSTENNYNFGVHQYFEYNLLHFVNDIDASNTVDGKPIYYWVNQHNRQIPADAGYVSVINSTDIVVKDLNLTKNWQGVLFAFTNNSIIENVNVSNNYEGFSIRFSSNITISTNTVMKNWDGIILWRASSNTLSGNTINLNDGDGIDLWYSNSNNIIKNTVTYTGKDGIHSVKASNNTIYHNNFTTNIQQVYSYDSTNAWDNGFEGNYWSNYTGVDLNYDGIGDKPHIINANNTDNYPLMGIFHSFNASLGYHVNVISNSTIEDFHFFESNSTIKMHVSNVTTSQTYGFCRVCIPHASMNETYHVTINGKEPHYWNYTLYDDGDNRWIYFTYEHSTLEIVIIPEFPSLIILPLFMIATLLAVIVYRRKRFIYYGNLYNP